MIVRTEADRTIVEAPAKINLFLELLGKRADGYHELATLMVTISLCDRLEFRRTDRGTTVGIDDPNIDASDNLVTRAVELVRAESARDDGLAIEVVKRIPIGAGLGGGSSNAAATICGLNELWNLNWPVDRQAELGARLGSDVPFFLYGTAAVATGRGERIAPCKCPTPLPIVLVCPEVGLSTKEVYARAQVPAAPRSIEPAVEALERGDLRSIAATLFNRLEEPARTLCPPLAKLEAEAAAWDCLGRRMSGSGSAYFALCDS